MQDNPCEEFVQEPYLIYADFFKEPQWLLAWRIRRSVSSLMELPSNIVVINVRIREFI